MTTFTAAAKPDAAYETWVKTWKPPPIRWQALPGWAIIEFSPFGNRGALFQPEEASNNAMVIADGNAHGSREGYLLPGTEVIYTGLEGEKISYGSRVFQRVPRAKIEAMVPKEKAA